MFEKIKNYFSFLKDLEISRNEEENSFEIFCKLKDIDFSAIILDSSLDRFIFCITYGEKEFSESINGDLIFSNKNKDIIKLLLCLKN